MVLVGLTRAPTILSVLLLGISDAWATSCGGKRLLGEKNTNKSPLTLIARRYTPACCRTRRTVVGPKDSQGKSVKLSAQVWAREKGAGGKGGGSLSCKRKPALTHGEKSVQLVGGGFGVYKEAACDALCVNDQRRCGRHKLA